MKFIALRSIDRDRARDSDSSASPTSTMSPLSGLDRDSVRLEIGGRDLGLRLKKYVNPSLILPLDNAWIPGQNGSSEPSLPDGPREGSI